MKFYHILKINMNHWKMPYLNAVGDRKPEGSPNSLQEDNAKNIPVVSMILLLFISLSMVLTSCSRVKDARVEIDLLPKVILYSGIENETAIQDLFFSDDYSTFELLPHPQIRTEYDSLTNSVLLQSKEDFSGYTSLKFNYLDEEYHIPIQVIKRKKHEFVLQGYFETDTIYVFGNFNNWDRSQYPMIYDKERVLYSGDIFFNPGRYEYRFSINGNDRLDPDNPERVPNGLGDFNSLLVVEEFFPGEMPHITPYSHHSGDDGSLEMQFKILKRDYIANISKADLMVMLDNKLISNKSYVLDNNDIIRIVLTDNHFKKNAVQRLRIVLSNTLITSNFLEIPISSGRPLSMSDEGRLWNDAVIYSIMIDRFSNGNAANDNPVIHRDLAEKANFQGGDLAGILQKIEEGYFNHLGINTLWISPWYQTSTKAYQETPEPHRWFSGYHGYWPTEPRSIDRRFGDPELLKELIATAHDNGIRVLMDFISNHVHEDHPYFQQHREWFGELELADGRQNLRLWDEQRLTTWFDPYIPSFDYLNSTEALETVVADAVWWMQEFGFDGFRHDAVKHVPNLFWRTLTAELRKTWPEKDIYQIGETFGDNGLIASYVNNGQLSAQFNFNQYWPARYTFATDSADFSELSESIEKSMEVFGQMHVMANIMDSHDQPRFPSYLEKDLLWHENAAEVGWNRYIQVDAPETYAKIAMYYSYLMTMPGIPVVYYGNEIGMTGAGDPDNRRMMRWGEDVSDDASFLRTNVTQLIGIRNRHPSLRYGDFLTLAADKSIFAYLRGDLNERLLVIIHRGSESRQVTVQIPEEIPLRRLNVLYGDVIPDLNGRKLDVRMQPWSGTIIELEQGN